MIKLILFSLLIMPRLVVGIGDEVCSIIKYTKDITKEASEESLPSRKRIEWSKLINLATDGIDTIECYKLKKSHSVLFGSRVFKFENYLFDKKKSKPVSQNEKDENKITKTIDGNQRSVIREELEKAKKETDYKNDSSDDPNNKIDGENRMTEKTEKAVESGAVISELNVKHPSNVNNATKLKPNKKTVNKESVEYNKDYPNSFKKQKTKEATNANEDKNLQNNDDKQNLNKDENESEKMANLLDMQYSKKEISKVEEKNSQSQDNHERGNINDTGKTEIKLSEEKEQDFEKTKIPGTNMTTEMPNEEDSEQSANELSKKFEIEITIKDDLSSVESSTNPDKHNVETNKKSSEETENRKSENSVKNIINNIAKPKNSQLESLKQESNVDLQQVIDDKEVVRIDKINEYEINKKDKNIIDSKSQTETLLQIDNEKPSQTIKKSSNERNESSNETVNDQERNSINGAGKTEINLSEEKEQDFEKTKIPGTNMTTEMPNEEDSEQSANELSKKFEIESTIKDDLSSVESSTNPDKHNVETNKKSSEETENRKSENSVKNIINNIAKPKTSQLESLKRESNEDSQQVIDEKEEVHEINKNDKNMKITKKAIESGAVISELNVKHPSNVNNATKLKPNKKTVNKESVEYNKDYPNSFKKQKTKEATNANEDKNLQNNDDKQNLNKDENESEKMANLLDMQYSKKEISKVEEKDSQSQDNHERGNVNDTGKTEIKLSEEKEQDFEKTKIPGTNMTTEMPNEEDSEQSANELSKKFEIEITIKDDLSSVESSTNPDKHNVETNKKSSEETENRKNENSVKNIINNIAKPKNSQLESLKQESNVDLQQVIDDKEVVRIDKINEYEINKKDKNIIDSKSQTDNENPSQTGTKSQNERREPSNENLDEIKQEIKNLTIGNQVRRIEKVQNDFKKKEIKKESEKNNQQDSQLSYMESKTNVLRPQPKDQKTKSKKSKKMIKTKSPITKKENSIKRETDPKLTAKNQLIDRSGAKGHINIRDNNTNERPIEELPKPSKNLSKTAKNKSVKGDKDDTNDTNTTGTGQSEQPHINEMNKTISKNLSNNSFTEKKFIKKEDFSLNQIENQECKSKQISVFYEIINYYKHNPKVQKSKVQKEEFQVKGKSINDQRKYEPPLLNLEQFSNTIDSHLSELLSESEKRISAAFSSRLSKFQRGISRLEYKLTILDKKLENIVTSQNNLEKKLLTIEQPHSQTSQCEPLLKEIRENIIQLKNLTRDLLMEKQKKNENVIYPENPKITLKNLHPEIIFLPCQFLQIVGFKICCIETKRITVKKISDKPRIVYENLKSCYRVKMEERIIKIILNDNKDLTKKCLCRNKSLVILQRRSGNVNFTRKWNEYKYGFGKLSDSFWIGLEFLHQLTKSDLYKLNIHIKDWDNNTFYARYDQFKINSENNGYQLYVKGYSGNSGDSLVPHNGKRFSTIDVDHDEVSVKFGGSCSNRFRGGWWYYSCYKCNPTGVFYEKGEVASQMFDGISWKTLRPPNYSFQEFVMSITSL